MIGEGRAPGTCGELVQGVTGAGEHFQVSCPVDVCAEVRVVLEPAAETVVLGLPAAMTKARQAVHLALDVLGLGPRRVTVHHDSLLPVGAGMGSSTADVLATVRAVAAAAGRRLPPDVQAELAGTIEPSDGTAYPGIAAVRRRGPALRRWAWWPRLWIAAFVPPGAVDTASVDFAGKEAHAVTFDFLLDSLDEAAARRDAAAFALAATRSAELNQRWLANPLFDVLAASAGPLGAWGVNVAHTGTAAGLLFPDRPAAAAALAALRSALPAGTRRLLLATPPLPPGG